MAVYFLSESDLRILRQLIARERNAPRPHQSSQFQTELPQASDVYVARTPHGGIPALVEYNAGTGTGTGTGTDALSGSESVPGSALCYIWRIHHPGGYDPQTVPVDYLQERVYNLATSAVPGDTWIPIAKDKFGFWLSLCCGVTGGIVSSTPQTVNMTADTSVEPTSNAINVTSTGNFTLSMLDPTGIPYGDNAEFLWTNTGSNTFTVAASNTSNISTPVSISPGGSLATTFSTTTGTYTVSQASLQATNGGTVAAGSTQANATQITVATTAVAGADGTKGVKLPDWPIGTVIFVSNASASILKVYPPSGQAIDSLGTNNPYSLGGNLNRTFTKISATGWSSS